ncbi:MAG: MFS transporter, partial [Bacteroidota bacterium]
IQADQTSVKYASESVKGSATDSMHTTTVLNYFADGTKQKIVSKQKIAGAQKLPAVVTKETVLGETGKLNMIVYIALMVVFVAMVYGPIAAFLVELFPTRIRYTSMSLPYHIGNGVFGGLVPFIATLITTLPGTNYLSGLWYPIIVAGLCFVIGSLYLSNKIDTKVDD